MVAVAAHGVGLSTTAPPVSAGLAVQRAKMTPWRSRRSARLSTNSPRSRRIVRAHFPASLIVKSPALRRASARSFVHPAVSPPGVLERPELLNPNLGGERNRRLVLARRRRVQATTRPVQRGSGGSGGSGGALGSGSGGLSGLLEQLQKGGLGAQTRSWVEPGQNENVSATQVREALGDDAVDEVAARAGVSREEAACFRNWSTGSRPKAGCRTTTSSGGCWAVLHPSKRHRTDQGRATPSRRWRTGNVRPSHCVTVRAQVPLRGTSEG